MRMLFQHCNLQFPNKDLLPFCSACCMGKAHRLSSISSTTQYNSPLELIFIDLWGPSPMQSENKYLYYMSIVDAHSRFTWIYLLKTKSEALETFKHYKTMVELQFNNKIKSVQTDWGGEFRPFTTYIKQFGILHRIICPYTHHQNGVVEKKHHHIVELGLSLLSQASLPLSFWDHAFTTAVYLINRLPSASLKCNTPYTTLFHVAPNYQFLKVFGCACFPLLRP